VQECQDGKTNNLTHITHYGFCRKGGKNMADAEGKRRRVRTVKSPEYRRYHVTGLYGGVTSHGEVEFSLLEDVIEVPEAFEVEEISEKLLREVPQKGSVVTRIVHASVVVPSRVLPSFIRWMTEKLEEAQQAQAALEVASRNEERPT
jgi:hypothetical protein